ncbi:Apolipophorin-like protein 2 [Sarcoptes scabiei]|uniref:Apolipophorin-like protein 2 n=1 Tax=Sarcoptes scabiei TaxID=52283 RepID=A0A132AB07_SARSC|nr:Apolipophorin-like protein 2 [Sarcoptes scabiei]
MFGLKVLFVLFPLALVSSEGLIFNHHKINQNQPEARTERFILSKRCQNGDSNDDARERYIRFSSNHTYVYDVQISNEVSAILNRTDSPRRIDETLITINGQAKLSPLNPCEVSLRLEPIDEEIKLYQRQFREPIVFAYKDGIITEIYSPITEHQVEPFVINVKKSIISALQTMPNILNMKEKSSTQKVVIETDYFGDCETDYEIDIAKDQSKISVRKQKDLLKCM